MPEAEGQLQEGAVAAPPPKGAPEAPFRRSLVGVVTSNKADKTITVRIERRVKHPIYGKFIRRSTRLHAHDEANSANEGDLVTIVQSRPISKTKSWALDSIVERAAPEGPSAAVDEPSATSEQEEPSAAPEKELVEP
ncbi:MAG: 30S ribosomal protein S17 [Gammaproteobacteria bacterium]|nr:30S ribosomal protein S17 [Gammaproteobacteria bacterium]